MGRRHEWRHPTDRWACYLMPQRDSHRMISGMSFRSHLNKAIEPSISSGTTMTSAPVTISQALIARTGPCVKGQGLLSLPRLLCGWGY